MDLSSTQRVLLAEIERLFPDEWVLILKPEIGPDHTIRSGFVAAHSPDSSGDNRNTLDDNPEYDRRVSRTMGIRVRDTLDEVRRSASITDLLVALNEICRVARKCYE